MEIITQISTFFQNLDNDSLLAGAAVGIVLFFLIRKFITKRDPLPKPEPDCVWRAAVTKITKVYDGDTIFAQVKGHNPIDGKPVGIRVRGVDTPEMKDKRPAVRKKAREARDFVESRLTKARRVYLYNVNMKDKYGRMLATVFCDGRDLAKLLIENKLAKPYDGGKKLEW